MDERPLWYGAWVVEFLYCMTNLVGYIAKESALDGLYQCKPSDAVPASTILNPAAYRIQAARYAV